jgi:hypothetical protein
MNQAMNKISLFMLIVIQAIVTSFAKDPPAPRDLPATSSPEVVAHVLSTVDPEDYLNLFEYDHTAPLNIREGSRTTMSNGSLLELSYASAKGGRVPALLLLPDGQGPFPAIILQHGSLGHKEDLINLADQFAGYGAAAFMIDDPYSRPGGWATTEYMGATWPYYTAQDMDVKIQTINDLQRAVDFLSDHPQIDPDRLAYMGISYGAAMGGLLAGVETRIKAYVLNVGDGGLVEHTSDPGSNGMDVHFSEKWAELMWPTESIHFVGRASPAALLFQNGLYDENVSPADAVRYQLAGSEPKTVRWYASDHYLPTEAYYSAAEWLQPYLGMETTWFTPSYRSNALLMDRLFNLWIGLAVVSFVALLALWAINRRAVPAGNRILWALTVLFLGPIGLGIFLRTDSRQMTDLPGTSRQALVLTVFTTTAVSFGLILADLWPGILPSSLNSILALAVQYLTALLIVWIFNALTKQTFSRRPLGTLISTNIVFAIAMVTGTLLAQPLGLGQNPDLRIWWVLASIWLLSAALTYPIHFWLVSRSSESWRPCSIHPTDDPAPAKRVPAFISIFSIALSYIMILMAISVTILLQTNLSITELVDLLAT